MRRSYSVSHSSSSSSSLVVGAVAIELDVGAEVDTAEPRAALRLCVAANKLSGTAGSALARAFFKGLPTRPFEVTSPAPMDSGSAVVDEGIGAGCAVEWSIPLPVCDGSGVALPSASTECALFSC